MFFFTFAAITIFTTVSGDMIFRVEGPTFMQKTDDGWKDFGQFAGVNFGITKPGYEPGQVILDYNDYMTRFQQLKVLGAHVIRVYSLLQPGFYQALLDWNTNNPDFQVFVLQGTAFPELEMEHNNGTDAYDKHITELMRTYIETTVAGVYGGGQVVYRYDYSHTPPAPIYGEYNYDISKYLIGWVIAGEISPFCLHATNYNKTTEELMPITPYVGRYVSSCYSDDQAHCNGRKSSRFETWVAEMFDLLASESIKHGHKSPISHTNWVTTDGISGWNKNNSLHSIEPRYLGLDAEYVSIEDWMEFDLHNFDFSKWEPGMFFNQHAYPYYPEFIKINGTDSYKQYLHAIKDYYSELPLIITEVGLPTSLGISSTDKYNNYNHGHNTESDQGDMMYTIMTDIISMDIKGVIVFQMYDEWFKKSWNTLKYDNNRQQWKNILTSEQYFGIFDISSNDDFKINMKKQDNIQVYNNYEFVIIHIDNVKPSDDIEIGMDIYPGGKAISNFRPNNDLFIKVHKDNFDFKVHSKYDAYMLSAGLWIDASMKREDIDLWENNGKMRHECYKNTCDFLDQALLYTQYNDYKMLVKWPTIGMWTDPNCNFTSENTYVKNINKCVHRKNVLIDAKLNITADITEYEAQVFTVQTKTSTDSNIALMERTNKSVTIKIPYQMLGYSNPAQHEKYFPQKYGKQFSIEYETYDKDIAIDIYINGLDNIRLDYNWDKWTIPKHYIIRPKESFNGFRMAFHKINWNVVPKNLTREELDAMIIYMDNTLEFIGIDVHYYLVKGSILFLIVAMGAASFGKLFITYAGYCYSSDQVVIYNKKLITLNMLATCGLLYIFFNIEPTISYLSISYMFYILLVIWDFIILAVVMVSTKWDLKAENNRKFNEDEHAFIIACHNSTEVIEATLESLLKKCKPRNIFLADNGSSKKESDLTKTICENVSEVYNRHHTNGGKVNYGYMTIGNKTIAQYGAVSNLPESVKYVTCIDDDTRLDDSWNVHKVIKYFEDDKDVVVLAYPLSVWNPKFDIEWFQAMEYLIVGYIKIFHSKVYSTIFNSGAFGTYRVEILREAFLYHNTDYHGDDLQICMNIHQLKNKRFHNHRNKIHTQNYKVATASDMIVSTIAPKCWVHWNSLVSILPKGLANKMKTDECTCGDPDLFQQRCKGWFVSKHRFIPRYIKLIFNTKGFNGSLWVRLIAFYELIVIINEYFAIIYMILFLRNVGFWMVEGFIIGYSFNIMIMTMFNWFVLKRNNLYIPYEVITIQPLVYKIIMITFYRYLGMIYHYFVYSVKHRSGEKIKKRLNDEKFREAISTMFPKTDKLLSHDRIVEYIPSDSDNIINISISTPSYNGECSIESVVKY